MPSYSVEPAIFEMFPAFRRGVVVATGIDNGSADPETGRLLAVATANANAEPAKIEVWNEAYRKFGVDPDKHTPSIRFHLRWTAPCGGDDLAAVEGGDLALGLAHGDETFAPRFKPAAVERPLPGEVSTRRRPGACFATGGPCATPISARSRPRLRARPSTWT